MMGSLRENRLLALLLAAALGWPAPAIAAYSPAPSESVAVRSAALSEATRLGFMLDALDENLGFWKYQLSSETATQKTTLQLKLTAEAVEAFLADGEASGIARLGITSTVLSIAYQYAWHQGHFTEALTALADQKGLKDKERENFLADIRSPLQLGERRIFEILSEQVIGSDQFHCVLQLPAGTTPDQTAALQRKLDETLLPLFPSAAGKASWYALEEIGPAIVGGPAMRWSGQELALDQHRIVDEVIGTYFPDGQANDATTELLPDAPEYLTLDPEGVLAAAGIRIIFLEGLAERIAQRCQEEGVDNPIDLAVHPARHHRTLILDPKWYPDLARQPLAWLAQLAKHELAHIENPGLSEKQIQENPDWSLPPAPSPPTQNYEQALQRLKELQESLDLSRPGTLELPERPEELLRTAGELAAHFDEQTLLWRRQTSEATSAVLSQYLSGGTWTLTRLHNETGIPLSTLSQMRTGTYKAVPSLDHRQRISQALGIPIHDLGPLDLPLADMPAPEEAALRARRLYGILLGITSQSYDLSLKKIAEEASMMAGTLSHAVLGRPDLGTASMPKVTASVERLAAGERTRSAAISLAREAMEQAINASRDATQLEAELAKQRNAARAAFRRLVQERNPSLIDLANRTGISNSTLFNLLDENYAYETDPIIFVRICEALGVAPNSLWPAEDLVVVMFAGKSNADDSEILQILAPEYVHLKNTAINHLQRIWDILPQMGGQSTTLRAISDQAGLPKYTSFIYGGPVQKLLDAWNAQHASEPYLLIQLFSRSAGMVIGRKNTSSPTPKLSVEEIIQQGIEQVPSRFYTRRALANALGISLSSIKRNWHLVEEAISKRNTERPHNRIRLEFSRTEDLLPLLPSLSGRRWTWLQIGHMLGMAESTRHYHMAALKQIIADYNAAQQPEQKILIGEAMSQLDNFLPAWRGKTIYVKDIAAALQITDNAVWMLVEDIEDHIQEYNEANRQEPPVIFHVRGLAALIRRNRAAIEEGLVDAEWLEEVYDAGPAGAQQKLEDLLQTGAASWTQILAIVELYPDQFERLYIDMDDTLFTAPGFVGSETWLRTQRIAHGRQWGHLRADKQRIERWQLAVGAQFPELEAGVINRLRELRTRYPHIQLIGLTARGTEEQAQTEEILNQLGLPIRVLYGGNSAGKRRLFQQEMSTAGRTPGPEQAEDEAQASAALIPPEQKRWWVVFDDGVDRLGKAPIRQGKWRDERIAAIAYDPPVDYRWKESLQKMEEAYEDQNTLLAWRHAIDTLQLIQYSAEEYAGDIHDRVEACEHIFSAVIEPAFRWRQANSQEQSVEAETADRLLMAYLESATDMLSLGPERLIQALGGEDRARGISETEFLCLTALDMLVPENYSNVSGFVQAYMAGQLPIEVVRQQDPRNMPEANYYLHMTPENLFLFLEPLIHYIRVNRPPLIVLPDTGARPFYDLLKSVIDAEGFPCQLLVFPISRNAAHDTLYELKLWLTSNEDAYKALFSGINPEGIRDQTVVILDDNITTGETMVMLETLFQDVWGARGIVGLSPFGYRRHYPFPSMSTFMLPGQEFTWWRQNPAVVVVTPWERNTTLRGVRSRSPFQRPPVKVMRGAKTIQAATERMDAFNQAYQASNKRHSMRLNPYEESALTRQDISPSLSEITNARINQRDEDLPRDIHLSPLVEIRRLSRLPDWVAQEYSLSHQDLEHLDDPGVMLFDLYDSRLGRVVGLTILAWVQDESGQRSLLIRKIQPRMAQDASLDAVEWVESMVATFAKLPISFHAILVDSNEKTLAGLSESHSVRAQVAGAYEDLPRYPANLRLMTGSASAWIGLANQRYVKRLTNEESARLQEASAMIEKLSKLENELLREEPLQVLTPEMRSQYRRAIRLVQLHIPPMEEDVLLLDTLARQIQVIPQPLSQEDRQRFQTRVLYSWLSESAGYQDEDLVFPEDYFAGVFGRIRAEEALRYYMAHFWENGFDVSKITLGHLRLYGLGEAVTLQFGHSKRQVLDWLAPNGYIPTKKRESIKNDWQITYRPNPDQPVTQLMWEEYARGGWWTIVPGARYVVEPGVRLLKAYRGMSVVCEADLHRGPYAIVRDQTGAEQAIIYRPAPKTALVVEDFSDSKMVGSLLEIWNVQRWLRGKMSPEESESASPVLAPGNSVGLFYLDHSYQPLVAIVRRKDPNFGMVLELYDPSDLPELSTSHPIALAIRQGRTMRLYRFKSEQLGQADIDQWLRGNAVSALERSYALVTLSPDGFFYITAPTHEEPHAAFAGIDQAGKMVFSRLEADSEYGTVLALYAFDEATNSARLDRPVAAFAFSEGKLNRIAARPAEEKLSPTVEPAAPIRLPQEGDRVFLTKFNETGTVMGKVEGRMLLVQRDSAKPKGKNSAPQNIVSWEEIGTSLLWEDGSPILTNAIPEPAETVPQEMASVQTLQTAFTDDTPVSALPFSNEAGRAEAVQILEQQGVTKLSQLISLKRDELLQMTPEGIQRNSLNWKFYRDLEFALENAGISCFPGIIERLREAGVQSPVQAARLGHALWAQGMDAVDDLRILPEPLLQRLLDRLLPEDIAWVKEFIASPAPSALIDLPIEDLFPKGSPYPEMLRAKDITTIQKLLDYAPYIFWLSADDRQAVHQAVVEKGYVFKEKIHSSDQLKSLIPDNRLVNALARGGFSKVADLLGSRNYELIQLGGFGPKSVNQIDTELTRHGLQRTVDPEDIALYDSLPFPQESSVAAIDRIRSRIKNDQLRLGVLLRAPEDALEDMLNKMTDKWPRADSALLLAAIRARRQSDSESDGTIGISGKGSRVVTKEAHMAYHERYRISEGVKELIERLEPVLAELGIPLEPHPEAEEAELGWKNIREALENIRAWVYFRKGETSDDATVTYTVAGATITLETFETDEELEVNFGDGRYFRVETDDAITMVNPIITEGHAGLNEWQAQAADEPEIAHERIEMAQIVTWLKNHGDEPEGVLSEARQRSLISEADYHAFQWGFGRLPYGTLIESWMNNPDVSTEKRAERQRVIDSLLAETHEAGEQVEAGLRDLSLRDKAVQALASMLHGGDTPSREDLAAEVERATAERERIFTSLQQITSRDELIESMLDLIEESKADRTPAGSIRRSQMLIVADAFIEHVSGLKNHLAGLEALSVDLMVALHHASGMVPTRIWVDLLGQAMHSAESTRAFIDAIDSLPLDAGTTLTEDFLNVNDEDAIDLFKQNQLGNLAEGKQALLDAYPYMAHAQTKATIVSLLGDEVDQAAWLRRQTEDLDLDVMVRLIAFGKLCGLHAVDPQDIDDLRVDLMDDAKLLLMDAVKDERSLIEIGDRRGAPLALVVPALEVAMKILLIDVFGEMGSAERTAKLLHLQGSDFVSWYTEFLIRKSNKLSGRQFLVHVATFFGHSFYGETYRFPIVPGDSTSYSDHMNSTLQLFVSELMGMYVSRRFSPGELSLSDAYIEIRKMMESGKPEYNLRRRRVIGRVFAEFSESRPDLSSDDWAAIVQKVLAALGELSEEDYRKAAQIDARQLAASARSREIYLLNLLRRAAGMEQLSSLDVTTKQASTEPTVILISGGGEDEPAALALEFAISDDVSPNQRERVEEAEAFVKQQFGDRWMEALSILGGLLIDQKSSLRNYQLIRLALEANPEIQLEDLAILLLYQERAVVGSDTFSLDLSSFPPDFQAFVFQSAGKRRFNLTARNLTDAWVLYSTFVSVADEPRQLAVLREKHLKTTRGAQLRSIIEASASEQDQTGADPVTKVEKTLAALKKHDDGLHKTDPDRLERAYIEPVLFYVLQATDGGIVAEYSKQTSDSQLFMTDAISLRRNEPQWRLSILWLQDTDTANDAGRLKQILSIPGMRELLQEHRRSIASYLGIPNNGNMPLPLAGCLYRSSPADEADGVAFINDLQAMLRAADLPPSLRTVAQDLEETMLDLWLEKLREEGRRSAYLPAASEILTLNLAQYVPQIDDMIQPSLVRRLGKLHMLHARPRRLVFREGGFWWEVPLGEPEESVTVTINVDAKDNAPQFSVAEPAQPTADTATADMQATLTQMMNDLNAGIDRPDEELQALEREGQAEMDRKRDEDATATSG